MNRFNLTFSGEIITGYNPAAVKRDFGRLFAIDDPARLERFFNGETVILRRNLERRDAADYFHQLKLLGAVAALVKVTEAETEAANPPRKPTRKRPEPEKSAKPHPPEKAAVPDPADQVWAVSSRLARKPERSGKNGKAAAHAATAPQKRTPIDISARIKARKQAAQREAEAEAAKAEADAAQRRKQHEEEKAERARKKAEEATRRKAEREEKQRRAAEEAARRKAEREEKKRREAEEAARRKAEREEKQRREAEEAARRRAEREEKQRREAEEAARRRAELEEKQRREAEEAARLQAEADLRRLESREAARLQAEVEDIKRQEQAAIEQVLAESRSRLQQAEQDSAARLRAARSRLLKEPLPHEPVQDESPAAPLQRDPPGKGADSQPAPGREKKREAPNRRKRQPGEPNLYQLRPFRNTREIRDRCHQARRMKRRHLTVGVIGLVLTLVMAERYFHVTPTPVTSGVDAVATAPGSGPVLLFGDTLIFHDRAGVATGGTSLAELGLRSLSSPLAIDNEGALLSVGALARDVDAEEPVVTQLLRCDLQASDCRALSTELETRVDTFVINVIDGSVITAGDSGLVKIGADGKLAATAERALPATPVLRLHAGLLFVNSAEGPGISVLRYEDAAFGEQLDEVLLLPGEAVEAGQSRVGDFTWSGGAWWVSLYNPDNGSVGVYRFDEDWNSLGRIDLPVESGPVQLAGWGEKTLINDRRDKALARFNAAGKAETPFISSRLADAFEQRKQRAQLGDIAWRGGLLVAALLTVAGLGLGLLHDFRQRVYKPRRECGAEPIDDDAHRIQWLDPVPERPALLRYRAISYGLASIALLLIAIAASVSVWQLAALLMALTGPAITLLLFSRQSIGHIGTLGNRLLLVDHSGMYHIAGGSGVQHRGSYLLIDDVVVFCGNALFPAFHPAGVREQLAQVKAGGVKVDRKTVLVKLLQGRHPLALGGCAIVLCTAAAIVLLSLQDVFW